MAAEKPERHCVAVPGRGGQVPELAFPVPAGAGEAAVLFRESGAAGDRPAKRPGRGKRKSVSGGPQGQEADRGRIPGYHPGHRAETGRSERDPLAHRKIWRGRLSGYTRTVQGGHPGGDRAEGLLPYPRRLCGGAARRR